MFKKIQTLPRHFKNNFSNSSTPVLEINNFQNDNEKMSSNEGCHLLTMVMVPIKLLVLVQ